MAAKEEPIRITTAAAAADKELAARQRRYVVSMAIRVVCFIGAALVAPAWPMWVLLVGAVFLPYVAVVNANTKDSRKDHFSLDPAGGARALGSGGEHPVLPGEVHRGDDDPHDA